MSIDRQDRLFDWLAPIYDCLIRRPEVHRLGTLLDLPPRGSLLDLAGGTGRVSRLFSAPGTRVVVCDINRSMLDPTQRKQGLLPLQADASALPCPDASVGPGLPYRYLTSFGRATGKTAKSILSG